MPVLVVDLLEVIDVRDQQRRAAERGAGRRQIPDRALEAAAVLESRERVEQRLALRLLELAGEELDLAGTRLEPLAHRLGRRLHTGGLARQLGDDRVHALEVERRGQACAGRAQRGTELSAVLERGRRALR